MKRLMEVVGKPLQPIIILSLLSQKDLYGYEIIERAKRLSHGWYKMQETQIYGELHRLVEEKLIESYWSQVDVPRKTYKLTGEGLSYLKGCQEEWDALRTFMNEILQ